MNSSDRQSVKWDYLGVPTRRAPVHKYLGRSVILRLIQFKFQTAYTQHRHIPQAQHARSCAKLPTIPANILLNPKRRRDLQV